MTRQIDLFCVPLQMSTEKLLADHGKADIARGASAY
jgi:hypothetical protein